MLYTEQKCQQTVLLGLELFYCLCLNCEARVGGGVDWGGGRGGAWGVMGGGGGIGAKQDKLFSGLIFPFKLHRQKLNDK